MTRDILLGIEIHADPATVFDPITTKDGLSSFWTSDTVAEPAVGSEARFGFPGAPVPLRMRVDELDRPTEVRWTCLGDFPFWEGTTVTWKLGPEPEHGGTRLLFTQTGFPDEQPDWDHATIVHTWAAILERLKQLAETGTATPALG